MKVEYLNCWEFKQCGREPNGIHAAELGVCPAASNDDVDGIHSGKNGGRCCWVFKASEARKNGVDSSFCEFTECRRCAFYEIVRRTSTLIVVI